MRHMFLAVGRLSITSFALGALSLGGLALTGCAGGEEPPDTSGTPTIAPRPNSVLFEFTGHASPKNRTLTTQLVKATRFGADLQPQNMYSLDLDQYGGGTPNPPNIVDMITDTNSCEDNYAVNQTFQCGVTLRQFYSRSWSNTFVEVTSILSDSGADISATHAGVNSYSGDTFGIDASKGLWEYTATGAQQGCLAQSPNNTGDQTWIFANPDDADTNYTFAIWATEYYADYTLSFGNLGYMDACSGGTVVTGNSKTGIALPFDFTIYGVNTSTVNIARNGQLTFGSTALTVSNSPIALPSTSAPHPVLFTFWDALKYGTGGQMCYQTVGTAPGRQFLVEWQNMTFSAGAGATTSPPASLDFEAYLYEGSGEIDTVYNTMTGNSGTNGRENGATAQVGIQDSTGTISTSEFQDDLGDSYGSGNAYSYIPSPD
jgi:hypothetical protein